MAALADPDLARQKVGLSPFRRFPLDTPFNTLFEVHR